MILYLGCGTAKIPGAIGVDNVPLPSVDVVHALLDFPYPFDDNSAADVSLNHVAEHFSLSDLRGILREVYRILQLDGLVHVCVPHVFSVAAWTDPTHKCAFTFESAHFWTWQADKSYSKDTDSIWDLATTTARVKWFNWKLYRMRQLDDWLSAGVARLLNWLSRMQN